MSLAEGDLAAIEQWLASSEVSAAEFRRRFPGVSFTRLDAPDVRGETPARICPPYQLYLLDGREHCVRLTNDLNAATGIVLVKDGQR